jgi:hypothetical protein
MTKNFIGPFPKGEGMRLEPAGNGGWIICSVPEAGIAISTLGAYSNASDMIEALDAALCFEVISKGE